MVGPRNRDRWSVRAVLVALIVVGVALVPATVGGADEADTGRIVSIHRTGDAVVTTANGTTYVWQSEQYTVNVTFQINAKEGKYSACLLENRTGEEPNPLDCQSATVGNGSTVTVSLNGSNATALGERTLYFRLRQTFGRDVPTIDSRTVNQTVIAKEGDIDEDGLTNQFEAKRIRTKGWPANAFNDSDMDGDGLTDGEEVNEWNTNPVSKDTDNDGLFDAEEVYGNTKPNDADSDDDKVDDGKDLKPMDPNVATSTTPAKTTTTTAGKQNGRPGNFSGMQLLLLGILGASVIGAAALLWRTGNGDDGTPPTSPAEADEATASTVEPEEDESDDILTDEGRVRQLLGNNRGRMKQVDIVEETGWSKSKVSRLLSRMEERGDVNRLRVGRGNIVYLDGAKPSGARSPHEEDSYS